MDIVSYYDHLMIPIISMSTVSLHAYCQNLIYGPSTIKLVCGLIWPEKTLKHSKILTFAIFIIPIPAVLICALNFKYNKYMKPNYFTPRNFVY